ncbi:MAG TPA: class I SAM-dependent methyltransferase [Streptosporangiaceae bacterium]|nr:class I SAM-dependent methyltransferase [Streptosporangiaceae bacterium]
MSDDHLGRQGAARTAVVWAALRGAASARVEQTGREHLDIVDAGGGTGGFAVPLACLGHRVTVVDPSPDSLAAAQRRAAERGVPIVAVQGDVADLPAIAGEEGADLVLCHSVLEYVDDPAAALVTIARVLRAGAAVSVLAAGAVAAALHRALTGRFEEARRLLADAAGADAVGADAVGGGAAGGGGVGCGAHDAGPPRRFTLTGLTGLIEKAGLRPGAAHGIRVFSDLVPSALVDFDPGAAGALLALEQAAAEHPALRDIATQLHVLGYR